MALLYLLKDFIDNNKHYEIDLMPVIIDHGLGLISIFAHLEKIFISENQLVSKGDLVGSIGMTGRATGPHLHWGIYLQNIPVDPEIFIDLNGLK